MSSIISTKTTRICSNMKTLLLASFLSLFATQAYASCKFDSVTLMVSGKNCPEDVVDIVERINACGHFTSELTDEAPEDQDRKAFLDGTVRQLKCSELPAQQRALKAKYADDVIITRFIQSYGKL